MAGSFPPSKICCTTVIKAALIVGWTLIVYFSILFLLGCILYVVQAGNSSESFAIHHGPLLLVMFEYAVCTASTILFIIGIKEEKRDLILVFLVVFGLYIALLLFYYIFHALLGIFSDGRVPVILVVCLGILHLCLFCFMWYISFAAYKASI